MTHNNPFFNRQRITSPTYFSGRFHAIEALYSAIATRQCRSIVGERKMGKSSLLTHLYCPDSLRQHGFDPDQYAFVYIDLEGMANITREEFWPEIFDLLEEALPDSATDLRQRAGKLAMQDDVRFMHARRLFRRIDRADITVVIMLDEFESLATNEAFNAGFYGELRSLAGELGVVYITASKRSLYDLTYRHADTLSSPFFNIFSEEAMGLLTQEEAEALLLTFSKQDGHTPFSQAQIEAVITMAGRHPFFLQLAGYHLYTAVSDPSLPLAANSPLPEQAIRRFDAEAEDHFRYLWQQLNTDEQLAIQQGTVVIDLQKRLQRKALLTEDKRPFSQAFAAFLKRIKIDADATTMLLNNSRTPHTQTATGLTGATLGNYRVLAPIGRGGMAVVYKGYQSSLDRYVAIKVMSHYLADDQTFVERFQREAASIASLRHQNIVQMYDFGLQQDISYMVMEYISGDTLKAQLTALRQTDKKMSLPNIAKTITDIAAALDYAHAHGIVHRDVKPANIMLRNEERLAELTGSAGFTAVLTDFGVARMLEGVQLTGTGATIGTPDYMSPEQAQGKPAGNASDVYALGIVLYEMLAGELPFTADTPIAVLLKHMQATPPSIIMKIPDLPTGLDTILMTALAKNPKDRYTTAGQLATAVRQTVRVGE